MHYPWPVLHHNSFIILILSYKWHQTVYLRYWSLAFWNWFHSLRIMPLRFIHICVNSSLILLQSSILLDVPQCVYPFTCWRHLDCFQALVIINSAAKNICVHIFYFYFYFYFLLLFNYSCVPFRPIPPPHPSRTPLPPPPPLSPLILSMCPL